MRILLLVEGQSDATTIPILARKKLARSDPQIGVSVKVMPRGDMFKDRKIVAHVREFTRRQPDLAKAIVCVDCHCTSHEQIAHRIGPVERKVRDRFPQVPTRYVPLIHALEAWLLADPQALQRALNLSRPPSVPQDPENFCEPDKELGEIYEHCGNAFRKTVNDPQIAEYCDIRLLEVRCPSFGEFLRALEDP